MSLQLCRVPLRSYLSSDNRIPPRRRITTVFVRCAGGDGSTSSDSGFDAKVFRHNLTRGKNYNRRGFGHKEETLELMNREYTSKLS
jgi:4-hydroxy-3-methylbut-2-enyl diphosphate reductase